MQAAATFGSMAWCVECTACQQKDIGGGTFPLKLFQELSY